MRPITPLLSAILPLIVSTLPAQHIWLPAGNTRNVSFDVSKGFYKATGSNTIDFASVAITAQGRFPIGAKTALTAAIPFARTGESFAGYPGFPAQSRSQTAFGNPWVGIEAETSPGVVIEAGIRPGVASGEKDEALSLGIFNDYDRFEAWIPEASSLRLMAHLGAVPASGPFITGIVGGTIAVPSEGETQKYVNYGMRVGAQGSGLMGTVAVTGRLFLSSEGGSFSDRTLHQAAFTVEGTRGGFRPSASVRIFLKDEFSKAVSAVATLGGSFVY